MGFQVLWCLDLGDIRARIESRVEEEYSMHIRADDYPACERASLGGCFVHFLEPVVKCDSFVVFHSIRSTT